MSKLEYGIPQKIDINLCNDNKELSIQMSYEGMTSNMQNDYAAFEGWAAGLKAKYNKIDKVSIFTDVVKDKLEHLVEFSDQSNEAL
jgi:hypothetical protein